MVVATQQRRSPQEQIVSVLLVLRERGCLRKSQLNTAANLTYQRLDALLALMLEKQLIAAGEEGYHIVPNGLLVLAKWLELAALIGE